MNTEPSQTPETNQDDAADTLTFGAYAQVLAFLGNSLLAPMRQTSDAGLSEELWRSFPTDGSADVRVCADEMADFVSSLAENAEFDPITDVSVEYTHLFVGPPKPAAFPWETMYRGEGAQAGFGAATHEMRALLREHGFELKNENNQYEDHMGIELLFASVLCEQIDELSAQVAALTDEGVDADHTKEAADLADLRLTLHEYLHAHPLDWADKLIDAVHAARPEGYFDHLLRLTRALLLQLDARLG